MKYKLAIVCCMVLLQNGSAQSILTQVVNSTGGYTAYSRGLVEYNVGEIAIRPDTVGKIQVYAGLLQPYRDTMRVALNEPLKDVHAYIYPQPIKNGFYLETDLANTSQVRIFDMLGNAVVIEVVKPYYDIAHLANGIYWIAVLDQSNEIIWNHKIIKINP